MNKVIISGSARKNGDTAKVIGKLTHFTGWDVIDLNDYQFGFYDYEHNNRTDDFLPLMRSIIAKYEVLIFATPIYWYSMSGLMKVFFDRITDLLTIEKDLGRKLRGKGMAAINCSVGDPNPQDYVFNEFWLPFHKSAEYLGMTYLGNQHFNSLEFQKQDVQKLIDAIEKF
ncbi:MAG: NAD(P)H-dependent oxidoreductase [Bacteroidota bacterium]